MGTSVSLTTRKDPTRETIFSASDTSLASFFERPITIATYTWTPLQAAPFTAILSPWDAFFGNPRVVNRINNFNSASAKLHVRFLINGNGFYYGRLMADYQPLWSFDSVSNVNTLEPRNAIQASQRMKVFLDPSDCCSQEMELPFVWYDDAISPNTTGTSSWAQLGKIYVREINALKHANGAVQPITITVMAWATDVQLSNPTSANLTGLVVQAGDEYGTGPVEHTATAVAEAAAALTRVPTIAPFARATQMMAGTMAKMAAVVGWSRPAIIAPLMGMRPAPISALAPCNAGDNVSKLTVDSKQEISVDSNVIGVDLPDELDIAELAARESYLTSFSWPTAAVAADLLWNVRVHPSVAAISAGAYYLPACAFVTQPFRWWRGKMRYRFQIVSSSYHRGRLRLVWDPVSLASVESNVQYQRIIDISTDKDVVIDVEWGMNEHYRDIAVSQSYGTALQATSSAGNGLLGVYVMNALSTPNSTINNDIFVNVFVSCNDLVVAQPATWVNYVDGYSAVVQAGDDMMGSDGNDPGCGVPYADETVAHNSNDAHDALVFFGERITNLRQLLRRYTYHSMIYVSMASALSTATVQLRSQPEYRGYEVVSRALHTTTGTVPYNYVTNHLVNYLAPAFVAARGSYRWKYVNTTNTSTPFTVQAEITAGLGPSAPLVPVITAMAPANQSSAARSWKASAGTTGAALAVLPVNPVLEFEVPDYNTSRFRHARQRGVVAADTRTSHKITWAAATTTNVVTQRYVSVGEDFSLMWFQGAPVMYLLADPA